jgi:penicillin-binding protein-related factor A (putative recombinase)
LPDYEGLLAGVTEITKAYRGVQFVFDCKVSSQAALELPDINMSSKSIVHQIKHLLKRQRYGALSFLLIHFNERKLATKTDKEMTVIFPVCDNAFWKSYLASEQKKISRSEAKLYGIEVAWDLAENKRTESPNLYAALETMVSRVTETNKQQNCKE